MRTVRRLYIYLVTLISLELVVWGLINLLQNSFSAAPLAAANLLASGLSLVLVGLPIFLLHGWIAQREARRDPEEQGSRLRALFHYSARFALLSPVILDLYNLAKVPLQAWLGVPPAPLSTGSTPTDRLIAIAINLAAWAALEQLLRADWRGSGGEVRPTPLGCSSSGATKRWSRYAACRVTPGCSTAWFVAVPGVLNILQYVLDPGWLQSYGVSRGAAQLVNGLSLAVVGVPLWVYCWGVIERTRDLPGERPSTLRWVVLYALALISALTALFTAQAALQEILQFLLGADRSLVSLFSAISQPLAAAVVFGVLWAYYSRELRREWAAEMDEWRRTGLRRLYDYPLALAGNAAVFAGAWLVLGQVVEFALAVTTWGDASRQALAGGIAWLVVGAPYWLTYWPAMQAEARRADDAGDHARRSVLRKSYLYLAVFLTVVGLMSSAGVLFYRQINALLGNPGLNLGLDSWQQVRSIALLAVWLAYHLVILRADGRLALRALAERQSAFPVLVLQSGDDPFYAALAEALQRQAAGLPVSFHIIASSIPLPAPGAARALVLPAALALDPPAELRAWLAETTGRRVLVPLPAEGWVWAGQPPRSARELARDTALQLRQLAEGQSPRPGATANPWVITGYVLGAVFALLIGLVVFSAFFGGF